MSEYKWFVISSWGSSDCDVFPCEKLAILNLFTKLLQKVNYNMTETCSLMELNYEKEENELKELVFKSFGKKTQAEIEEECNVVKLKYEKIDKEYEDRIHEYEKVIQHLTGRNCSGMVNITTEPLITLMKNSLVLTSIPDCIHKFKLIQKILKRDTKITIDCLRGSEYKAYVMQHQPIYTK